MLTKKKGLRGPLGAAILLAGILTIAPAGAASAWIIDNPDPPVGSTGTSGGKGIQCNFYPGTGMRCSTR